jgi:hypothetical protein
MAGTSPATTRMQQRNEKSAAARKQDSLSSRGRSTSRIYLRAAQAYMLISMPTGTSTIFGVFQLILNLP